MNFNFFAPVRIISGINCIKANPDKLILGKKAFIVTGASGAKKSGALDDVIQLLSSAGVAYTVFDKCRENPPLEICFEGGRLSAAAESDFVIGIGGGSAIDSAKAVAAFAANPEIGALDIFDSTKRANAPLPLVAVPTTSGTGSEANGTAVMSLPDGKTKKSFGGEKHFPAVSFLDPRYTYSLPAAASMSCALDAFAHALESYVSPHSTVFSENCALFAAERIIKLISAAPTVFSPNEREALQYASCAAGFAISATGTGFPHALGYSLTMLDGIPHGAACAIFDGDYIEYNLKTNDGCERVNDFCRHIGVLPESLSEMLPLRSGVSLSLTEEEIRERVALISGAKNYVNSPYVLSDNDKLDIYRKHFLK